MLPPDHRLAASAADPSLLDHLAAAARRAPDGLLALMAGAGSLLTLAVALFWWPGGWPLLPAALAVGCFGGWGMADRTLADWRGRTDRTGAARALDALRAVAGAVGVASAVFFLLGVVAFSLTGVIH